MQKGFRFLELMYLCAFAKQLSIARTVSCEH